MKRGFDRAQRIADLLQKALAVLLQQQMDDERFRFVTITGVTLSRDLSYAKVYVSTLTENDQIKALIHALNRAAKTMRYHLAKEVKLRVIPELKFIYDESTAHGFRISALIDTTIKKDPSSER